MGTSARHLKDSWAWKSGEAGCGRRIVLLPLVVALATAFLCLLPASSYSQTDNETCLECHSDVELVSDDDRPLFVVPDRFARSVHGDFDCTDCHSQEADYEDFPHFDTYEPVECGTCHEDAADAYSHSVHHTGRYQNGKAANCVSCHGSHYVYEVADTASMANARNVPNLCAECHGAEAKITKDYVRLPIAVPNYLAGVHGLGWKEGKRTAVCTDCHGSHDLRVAQDPESRINRQNVSHTCGQCHDRIASLYDQSIHGRAVAIGISDSPTCTDCHDEHLIRKHLDPAAKISPEHRAQQLCGNCHTDPELVAKYGIEAGVVKTYLDSYHGWAVDRGSKLAATCTDCHTVHDIRSPLDPMSTVNAANVTATCSRCHQGATPTFAASYTHASALAARTVQGWVRLFYIGLIVFVLGGMALHNFIVARFELRRHLAHRRGEPYIVRWTSAERIQHMVLLLSFTGLAITGFALRYPEAWWVGVLGLGGHEAQRANLHRTFAVIMMGAAVYHIVWILASRRGRWTLGRIVPVISDPRLALQNMAFYLGLRKTRPVFEEFDYTQKAEYWAVVWGTWVMALTGLVLWFPTVATRFAPEWIVRVSEVIHFYEAVLAVSAIVIWHFFYVIFLPGEYPMSTVWIDGRMPAHEWNETRGGGKARASAGTVLGPSGEAGDTEPTTTRRGGQPAKGSPSPDG